MLHRKVIVLLVLMLTPFSFSYAQNDWREGFIIESSGDTTYGFIDYRDYKSNSKLCYFRNAEKGEIQKLKPFQILGYRYLNDKYYVSKTVRLAEEEENVFLEFLIQGTANVYCYNDDDKHYFLEKDGQIYELKNSEVLLYTDGARYLREKREYVGMLKYHFQQASIDKDIQNSEFNHKSLIKLAKKYHEKVCNTSEECIVFEKKARPVKVSYGIAYGANIKTIHFLHSLGYYDVSRELSNYGGIIFDFQNIPGIYERFSLQIGILGNSYYFRKGYYYYNGEMYPNDKKKYSLNVPIMVNYKLSSTKIYPKLEVGASSYLIHSEELKAKYMTLAFGISMNYEFYKDIRVFINTRYEQFVIDTHTSHERSPGILRFGGGLLF